MIEIPITYRGFYIDAARTIDFLLSRDEVDGERIGVTGSSQGGGLAISTAALRPEVRAAAAGCPYLCGYMDSIELTHTYPYQEISDYLRLYPERREAVCDTLAYFDGITSGLELPVQLWSTSVCRTTFVHRKLAMLSLTLSPLRISSFTPTTDMVTMLQHSSRTKAKGFLQKPSAKLLIHPVSLIPKELIMSNTSRPEDFDAYWQQVCGELEATPIAAEEEHLPIRSTEYCECYTVRFTGIGPYRLFGYLSIPHGDGPFPTLLLGPAYRSVVDPLPQGDANENGDAFSSSQPQGADSAMLTNRMREYFRV